LISSGPGGASTALLAVYLKNCDLVFVVVHDEEKSGVSISRLGF
jgi:hypothetical protein